tara:strand:- start:2760 stop:3896 length:1137 start_codon:yes stop_codon:yes gene_type:complete
MLLHGRCVSIVSKENNLAAKKYREGAVSYFKKGTYWHAYWTDQNTGLRGQRSLRCTTQRMAKEEARKISDALDGNIIQKLDAVRDNKKVTFGETVERYLDECDLAEKSLKEDRTRLDMVRLDWEDLPISSIDAGQIDSWLAKKRRSRGWSRSTRNRYLSAIKQVFKKAHSLNYTIENQAAPLKALKEEENIPEPLTDAVMDALMQVLPEYAKYYVAILVDTGLRRGELAQIRWRDVDTANRQLIVRKSKAKTFRVIPMTDRLAALFDSLRSGRSWAQTQSGHSSHTLVWPDDSNPEALVIGPIDLKKSLISASKQLGIGHIHPHQFRHTFATRLMQRGVSMEHIMALGGWKSATMAKRYARVNPVELHEQIKRLETEK